MAGDAHGCRQHSGTSHGLGARRRSADAIHCPGRLDRRPVVGEDGLCHDERWVVSVSEWIVWTWNWRGYDLVSRICRVRDGRT